MPLYTKNGNDIYDIEEEIDPNTGESVSDQKAKAKGYQQVIEVTKNGADTFHIPVTELTGATKKGYVTKQEFDAKQAYNKEIAPGPIESTARGVSQGVSLGFADELQAGLGAIARKAQTFGSKESEPISETYTKLRDAERERNGQAQEAHPYVYGGSELVGGLGVPVGTIGKGAGLAAKIGYGALTGAAIGGVAGTGYSEAEDISDIAKEAAIGAGVGGTIGAALPIAGAAVKKALPVIGESAGKLSEAVKENLIKPSHAEKVNEFLANIKNPESGKIENTIQNLTDQGLFKGKVFTKDALGKKAQNLIEKDSDTLDVILKDTPINQDTFQFDNTYALIEKQMSEADKNTISNIMNGVSKQLDKAKTLSDANKIKRNIYDKIQSSYSRSDLAPTESTAKQAYKSIATDLRQGIEDNYTYIEDHATNSEKAIAILNPKRDEIRKLNENIGANIYLKEKLAQQAGGKLMNMSDALTGGLVTAAELVTSLAAPGLGGGVIAGKFLWKTTPVKMIAIKALDSIEGLLGSGKITPQKAAGMKYKIINNIKANPKTTMEDIYTPEELDLLQDYANNEPAKAPTVSSPKTEEEAASKLDFLSQKNESSNTWSTGQQEEVRNAVKDIAPFKKKLSADKANLFIRMTPNDEWEPVVQEIETLIPRKHLGVNNKRGTNAKVTPSGKIFLPNEGEQTIASTMKSNNPEEYQKIIDNAMKY